MSKPKGEIEMFRLNRVPTNPTAMLDRIKHLEAEVAKLRPKRRHDPELAGLYPQKSGGVSVYLLPVGSGIKDRAALYLGIARDMVCAKIMQKNARAMLLRVFADPWWAHNVISKADGIPPQERPFLQNERCTVIPLSEEDLKAMRDDPVPFGTAIQLAEEPEAPPTEPPPIGGDNGGDPMQSQGGV